MHGRLEPSCAPDEGVVGEHRLLSQLLGGVNGGDSARHALCAESNADARTGGRALCQVGVTCAFSGRSLGASPAIFVCNTCMYLFLTGLDLIIISEKGFIIIFIGFLV